MKIDATDPKCPEWQKHLFTCDCGENHYVHVSWWEDEDENDWPGFLELNLATWDGSSLGRIKAAWKVLFGQPHYHDGILLDEKTAQDLIDLLTTQRERKGKDDGEAEQAI